MKILRLIVGSFLLFCFSCNSDKNEEGSQISEANEKKELETSNQDNQQKQLFLEFIKKFKPLKLPYIYRLSNNDNIGIDFSKLKRLNSHSNDTLFLKAEYFDEVYCYAILSDSSGFYSLIFFFPGEDFFPVLATYTRSGERISQEPLTVNGCGSDCGLTYCSQTAIIDKNLSIESADTINYDFHCDDAGNLVNEGLLIVESKRGKLNRKGKIEMEKVISSKKKFKSNKPLPKE